MPHTIANSTLTQRELEVIALVAHGASNNEAAAQLWLSPLTIKGHLERIAIKLGTGSRAGMVGAAYRTGVLPVPRHARDSHSGSLTSVA